MHTQGEGHVRMKAEIRVMLLQAKEHQRWPANRQQSQRHGTEPLTVLRRNLLC